MKRSLKVLSEIATTGMGFPLGVVAAAVISMAISPEAIPFSVGLAASMLILMTFMYCIERTAKKRYEKQGL